MRELLAPTVLVVLALGIVTAVLGVLGLFDFTGTEASAKIVAAAIALVGAFFTAMVTLVGLFLKQSLDKRNLALKQQAENRLRLDSAIEAVKLFRAAAGSASRSEKAGALFALAKLDQLDFALRLLEHLWPTDEIDSSSAVWIADRGIDSDSGSCQELAGLILEDNAQRLVDCRGGMFWPASVKYVWNPDLDPIAQDAVFAAVLRALLSREFSYWNREHLSTVVVLVNSIRTTSSIPRIKAGATLALMELVKMYGPHLTIHPPAGPLQVDALRDELRKQQPALTEASHAVISLTEQLSCWVQPGAIKSRVGAPEQETEE